VRLSSAISAEHLYELSYCVNTVLEAITIALGLHQRQVWAPLKALWTGFRTMIAPENRPQNKTYRVFSGFIPVFAAHIRGVGDSTLVTASNLSPEKFLVVEQVCQFINYFNLRGTVEETE